jgi:hypothetical protein
MNDSARAILLKELATRFDCSTSDKADKICAELRKLIESVKDAECVNCVCAKSNQPGGRCVGWAEDHIKCDEIVVINKVLKLFGGD